MVDPQGAGAGGGEVTELETAAVAYYDTLSRPAGNDGRILAYDRFRRAVEATKGRVEVLSMGVVGFKGVALESVSVGAAVYVEINTANGRASVRPARVGDP